MKLTADRESAYPAQAPFTPPSGIRIYRGLAGVVEWSDTVPLKGTARNGHAGSTPVAGTTVAGTTTTYERASVDVVSIP